MSLDGSSYQICNAYYQRQVIQIGANNVTVSASRNYNINAQKWTFWRVWSDDSYVIRNYPSGQFLGLLYHGKLVGVKEDAAIHWDIQPSGFDHSTCIIRMKNDRLNRVLTLAETDGDIVLEPADFSEYRRNGSQEWRLRQTEYNWPDEHHPFAEFLIESEATLEDGEQV